jgi:hypothetical protein
LLQSGVDKKYSNNCGEILIDFGNEAKKLFRVLDEIFGGRSGLNKPIEYLRGSVSEIFKIKTFFGQLSAKKIFL